MMCISVSAEKVSTAPVQGRACGGEAVVIVGLGLIQVGAKAECRTIRVRKGGQPDPDTPRSGDRLTQSGDQPAADPRLGRSCHALGERERTDRP
jgi:hypothetical protein